ncbi:MAG TPA: ABC transporter permease [Candidatus Dormibacteraeota bacterium]|jgi:putative ABC transport system permease protein|nr:ABC transporter permease [Candidatus Dormibacteraeota bacterium]
MNAGAMNSYSRWKTLLAARNLAQVLVDFNLGFENLMMHKLRSLLTMLGMIFGVAAVIAMLSIGAGARAQVMALIEQMGVRNVIVEAHEVSAWEDMEKIRKISMGLSLRDFRVIQSNVSGIVQATPRKRFTPGRMIPKPQHDMPVVYGISPNYQQIGSLKVVAGRFFDDAENDRAAPVAVLGQGAKASLFGQTEAVGQYVKINEAWFHVVGVVGPQLSAQTSGDSLPAQDLNNLIYVPLYAAMFRLEDSRSNMKDEIDGIYLQLSSSLDTLATADVVRSLLNISHRDAGDFSVIAPAELLAQQQRTQHIFDLVMVAIASISLLVGGIGIMNIMLAAILERTREIGVRRALGARQRDVIRQFLVEAVLISLMGGLLGIAFGFGISRLIAWLAGWSTVTTFSSIVLSFAFSVSIGLLFGIYPARQAARLDPVEAIRYE